MNKRPNFYIYYYVAVIVGYLLIAFTLRFNQPAEDIQAFYVPAVKNILAGYPLSIYSIRVQVFGVSFPNSPTPLLYFLITPFVWLTLVAGITDSVKQNLIIVLPFLVFDVLAALEIRNTIKRVAPTVGENLLLLASTIYLFSPTLFAATGAMGHGESIPIYFALLGYRYLEKKPWASGLVLAVAFLFKQPAILLVIPALLFLLIKDRMKFLEAAGTSLGLVVVVLAPFFIRHFSDTYYSLIAFEGLRPIIGVNIWQIFVNTRYQKLATSMASLPIVPLATILSFALLIKKPVPRIDSLRMYGAIAVSALMLAVFAKWVAYHYFLLPLAFLIIWDLVSFGQDKRSMLFSSIIFLGIVFSITSFWPGVFPYTPSLFFLVRCVVMFIILLALVGYVFYQSWTASEI